MGVIAFVTNLTGVTEKIDYFSDELGIDFDTCDIEDAIDECRRAKYIGGYIWLMFMNKVQGKWENDYPNFDSDKFGWYLKDMTHTSIMMAWKLKARKILILSLKD